MKWQSTKGGKGGKKDRWEDSVDMLDLKATTDFQSVRFVGDNISALIHWITVITKKGEEKAFPAVCCDWDGEKEAFKNKRICPACKCEKGVKDQTVYLGNAIDRDAQEDQPKKAKMSWELKQEKNNKFRSIDDNSWSPMVIVRLPASAAEQLRDITNLNIHKVKGTRKTVDVAHNNYGCDLHIKYDPDGDGSAKYNLQKGETAPLTKTEKKFLLWKLKGLVKPGDLQDLTKSLIRLGHLDTSGAPIQEETTGGVIVSKKKLLKFAEELGMKKKKAKKMDEEELQEEILDAYDEDEEDDYSKALRKFHSNFENRKKVKKKGNKVEDNDNNDNDNDDDEEEEPEFDEMKPKELIKFCKDNDIKLSKKELKFKKKKLAALVEEKYEELQEDDNDNDNDNDDNDNDNNDDNDDNDNDNNDNDNDDNNDDDNDNNDNDNDDDEEDIEDMDKEELLDYAKQNIKDNKKFKKVVGSLKKLKALKQASKIRKAIAKALKKVGK